MVLASEKKDCFMANQKDEGAEGLGSVSDSVEGEASAPPSTMPDDGKAP